MFRNQGLPSLGVLRGGRRPTTYLTQRGQGGEDANTHGSPTASTCTLNTVPFTLRYKSNRMQHRACHPALRSLRLPCAATWILDGRLFPIRHSISGSPAGIQAILDHENGALVRHEPWESLVARGIVYPCWRVQTYTAPVAPRLTRSVSLRRRLHPRVNDADGMLAYIDTVAM
jgi:hypothetical protein